jgi:hypothetical protein
MDRKFLCYIFLFTALSIFVPQQVRADTLYLRQGMKVSGKIMEETPNSIKIKVKDIPVTYYRSEVEKIERDKDMVKTEQKTTLVVTEEKKALIFRLLEANGARESMARIFVGIIERAPENARDALKTILKVDDVIELLVPIYAQYYNDSELKDLIEFYRSPVGAKHVQTTPKIVEESMGVAIKYFQEKIAAEGIK